MLRRIRRVFQKFASLRTQWQHQEGQGRPNSRKFSFDLHTQSWHLSHILLLLYWNILLTPHPFHGLFFSVCLHVCLSYSAAAAMASVPPLEHARPFWGVSLLWDFLCYSGFLQAHLLVSCPDFQIPAPIGSLLSSYLLSHPVILWTRLWLLAFAVSSHSTYDLLPYSEQHVLTLMLKSLQAHQEEANLG